MDSSIALPFSENAELVRLSAAGGSLENIKL